MTTNAEIGLQTVLGLLGGITSVTHGVEGVTFNGIDQANDLFIGDIGHNTAKGKEGNDILLGNDGNDHLFGDAGDDAIFGGNGDDILKSGIGNDTIFGDAGNDLLVGDSGVDRLTGGEGRDQFAFTGDVFANGVPALAGETGINVLNQPDVISDFTIGEDQFALNGFDLDLNALNFQKGQSSQIAGDGNVIVLTDPFPAAGAAARGIANNDNIKAGAGAFVYFNSTLGLTRLAYSQDLGNGGDVSVLANLENQQGEAGLANVANFSATDFTLV